MFIWKIYNCVNILIDLKEKMQITSSHFAQQTSNKNNIFYNYRISSNNHPRAY